jgi:hypothetical protein
VLACRILATGVALACLAGAGCSAADPPAAGAGGSAGSTPAGASATGPSPAGSGAATTTASPSPTASPTPPPPELPRGGRTLFPRYRLVGYSGAPFAEALGRLGIGDLDDRAREIERRLAPYAADGRELMPVLELITTVVHATPGADGLYRTRQDSETIATHLRAARKVRGLLLLNIQPGRADFLDEAKAYEKWLRQPDVGLALDPEWAVGPGERPGQVYGSATGAELDAVGRYVSGIVRARRLPQKVIVFHQVAPSVVRQVSGLRPRPGIAWVRSVDGIGSPKDKVATWRRITEGQPRHIHGGFKLFYVEDRKSGPLMTPRQVLALRPRPEYVLYE